MSDLKYRPGRGPRRTSSGRPLSMIELVTFCHLAIYVILASWYFGGCSDNARMTLSWWGTIGGLILVIAIGDKAHRQSINLGTLKWLWPLGAFNALVLISCLTPNFRALDFGADVGFVKIEDLSIWIPSSAFPADSLRGLWLFDALFVSCFSATVTISQRRVIRWLLGVAVANAVVLAVFGTFQKLGHAKGLFFNAVPSPQPSFFASFVYDNHWGAFTILMTAICLGMIARTVRRQSLHDFFHSPAVAGLIGLLLLAISVPLSNSRACSALLTLLFALALAHWLTTSLRRRKAMKESRLIPIGAAAAAVIVGFAAIWYVASDSIRSRLETTKSQFAEMQAQGSIGGRKTLYRDTLRMGDDLPVFGWGMNSYPHVFMLYNTQESKADDLPVFYNDAHSDWLQSFAEHGIVGTLLLACCALIPLRCLLKVRTPGPIPGYLLGGCALILAYSWIEFPFGNPAVVLSWWFCLFCAVRYTLLESAPAAKAT